ncbi:GTPase IMAP family member 7-like [Cyclopterus lumpus]|uniref:GTPase IMAP family member 8 n=1 Tax=Cyclopterus lumpus TaxID=8103 RepID=A0A8C2WHQ7_CYCLU|nr:GTPase IMAP family member 7-like [Cyclopterus lumpus]
MSSNSFQSHCRPAKGLTIVMFGQIGVGKSTTGNTVLGRPAFWSCVSSKAVTRMCQMESAARDGENLTVVDTPGLGDARSQAEVMREVQRCLLRAPGGPVVFLVVVQSGRFTQDEQRTVRWIQSAFGPQAAHYTMALFTRADDLRAEGRSVDQVIGADPAMQDFIRECCGGYHVLDNRDSDPSQVVELLQKINSLVQRNGGNDGARFLREESPGGNALRDVVLTGCFITALTALLVALSKFK